MANRKTTRSAGLPPSMPMSSSYDAETSPSSNTAVRFESMDPNTDRRRDPRLRAPKPPPVVDAKQAEELAAIKRMEAEEREKEKSVHTLLRNVQSRKSYEHRGNPGVFDVFQPISEDEFLADMALMGVAMPPKAQSQHQKDSFASDDSPRPLVKRKAPASLKEGTQSSKRIAAVRSSTRVTSTHSSKEDSDGAEPEGDDSTEDSSKVSDGHEDSQVEDDDDDFAVDTDESHSIADTEDEADPEVLEDAASDVASDADDEDNTTSDGSFTTITDAGPMFSVAPPAPSPRAAPSTTGQTKPDGTRSAAAIVQRQRNQQPITGANGFRLLHPQHRFVADGSDQSAHLAMRYVDDAHPGVEQTHTYTGRGGPNHIPEIDWRSKHDVAVLNRWSNQVLKRHGAATGRAEMVRYSEAELEWLRELGRRMEAEGELWSKERQAREFNERWAGAAVDGKERLPRTKDSLQAEILRKKLYPDSLKARKTAK